MNYTTWIRVVFIQRIRVAAVVIATTLCLPSGIQGVMMQKETSPQPRFRRFPDGLEYAWIPPGDFLMGSVAGDKEAAPEEGPRHSVTLSHGYWLSRTEVTVAAFRRFVQATRYVPESQRKGQGRIWVHKNNRWEWVASLSWECPFAAGKQVPTDWPVVQVSWADAAAYCRWAGGRLPTEAEWERAARGGKEGLRFPWGNELPPIVNGIKQANGPDECTKRDYPAWETVAGYNDGYSTLAPVAKFAPNGFGLYDLAGNTWEWTADYWGGGFSSAKSVRDPKGAAAGDSRIVRGGAWCYSPRQMRCSERGYFEHQDFWTASLGFRCVQDGTPP